MKYLDYHENRRHGTIEFPIAFYHLSPTNPRYEMPYHWHKEYELIHVIEGDFNMIIDDQIKQLTVGDIILLQDGVLHGGNPFDCVYECIVFDLDCILNDNHLHLNLINNIINHHLQILQVLPKDDAQLNFTIQHLFEFMRKKPHGYEFHVKGSLLHILSLIIQLRWYSDSPYNFEKISHKIIPLKKVLKKIESSYMDSLTLVDLAKEAGMNARYFCRYFKQLTQKSPIEYLNYYRIESACEQLMSTNASITEIALNCGFTESSYFSRTFKKFKGITPKQYKSSTFN